jgi:hypothetical protein
MHKITNFINFIKDILCFLADLKKRLLDIDIIYQ